MGIVKGYEGPRVFIFLIVGFFLSIFWIARLLKNPKKVIFTKADYFYLVWLLILLISSLMGIHPIESVVGGSYRHQGVIFFLTLWLVKKTFEILSISQKEVLKSLLVYGVFFEAIIVLLQVIFGKVYFGRPLGTLGEPNAVAGFLAIGSSFVPFWPFLLIPIILTNSRAGLTAFFILALGRVSPRYRKIGFILLPFAALLIVGLISKPVSIFENRPLFWKFAVQAIAKKPLLGYGAESNEVIYDRAFAKAQMPLEGMMVDRSHNLFLDIALWSGIVGLTPFVIWLVLNFNKNPFAMAGWLTFACLQPLGVVHWVIFVLILSGFVKNPVQPGFRGRKWKPEL